MRRPGVNLPSQWNMVGSYAKVSGRNILRNRLFSTINIAGLAISMSVGLLLIVLLSDVKSYDKFHQNYNRIYRVITQNIPFGGEPDHSYYASTSLLAGKEISESISGPQAVAVLYRQSDQDLKFEDKTLPFSGLWANEDFFKVFSFPLVSGNPATALSNPYSIVLTETSAKKLFGDKDPIGKTITSNASTPALQYVVTGVMKDVPKFSHLQFEMLISLSTRQIAGEGQQIRNGMGQHMERVRIPFCCRKNQTCKIFNTISTSSVHDKIILSRILKSIWHFSPCPKSLLVMN